MAEFTIPIGVETTLTAEFLFGPPSETQYGYTTHIRRSDAQVPPGMDLLPAGDAWPTSLVGTPTELGTFVMRGGLRQAGFPSTTWREDATLIVAEAPPAPPAIPHDMWLDDTVTIKSGDETVIELPARVGNSGVSVKTVESSVFAVEELRALIPPWPELQHEFHTVEWRGDTYSIDGPPLVSRRYGQDHHLTLKLKRLGDV